MQGVHDVHLVDSMSYLKLAIITLAFCGGLKGETRVLDEIGRQVCGTEFGSEFQKPHKCSINFNHGSPMFTSSSTAPQFRASTDTVAQTWLFPASSNSGHPDSTSSISRRAGSGRFVLYKCGLEVKDEGQLVPLAES